MDPLTDGMLVLPQASLDCPIPVKYRKSISAETFPQISVSKIHAPIDITGSAANSFLIRQIFRTEGFRLCTFVGRHLSKFSDTSKYSDGQEINQFCGNSVSLQVRSEHSANSA